MSDSKPIISVHGTFAGDASDVGDKWWQQGSFFFEGVGKYVSEKLDVQPFHWSGANSEIERRKAAVDLSDALGIQPEKPLIIAHSHGGSITAMALDKLSRDNTDDVSPRISGAISVGTPLLKFRQRLNPFVTTSAFTRLLLLLAVLFVWSSDYERLGDVIGEFEGLSSLSEVPVALYYAIEIFFEYYLSDIFLLPSDLVDEFSYSQTWLEKILGSMDLVLGSVPNLTD
ncbi:hypothetical protein [Parvularcula sp. IMCC14364]|uniref:hypothetical protein n=1 Tax=Parvularcula sp. IMCC14364 TaxID=3067902 RepID=UPI00274279E0|nr:hypothetical protein [Parvularcula sp. IMCC14364]